MHGKRPGGKVSTHTPRRWAINAAKALEEKYSIGTSSPFCDDPPDWDSATTEEIAVVIESAAEDTQEAIKRLVTLQSGDDKEADHIDADNVLLELLQSLGYDDVVTEYCKVPKWCA